MKRIMIAITVSGLVAAAVLGFAASLNVRAGDLGAGVGDVASCDEAGVTVSYTVTEADPRTIDAVTIDDIATACDGQTLHVALLNEADAVIGTTGTRVLDEQTSHTFTLTSPVDADEVHGVAVTIAGAGALP